MPVRRDEVAALLWSFAYFFCLLAAYYVIRPVRDEMAVQFGADRLQWLFSAVFATMVALIPVFGWLAARLPVNRLLPAVYGFFALNLRRLLRRARVGRPLRTLAPAFFVWVSVFNLFVVSVFWSFMADVFTTDAARRLFGFISAGGSLGAIVGPGLTAWLAPAIGIPNLLIVSAALLGGAIGCIAMLLRLRSGEQRFLRTAGEETGTRPRLWEGVIRIARSPYLIAICVYLVCYTLLGTMLYFAQTKLVGRGGGEPGRPHAALRVGRPRCQRAHARPAALRHRPPLVEARRHRHACGAAGASRSAASSRSGSRPLLPVLVVFGVLRRAGEFAISKPTRETLFTVVPKEEKYQAKNVIDTVIHRGGDAASGWVAAALLGAGLGLPGLAFAGVPVACLWLAIAVFLGRRHERLRAEAAR